MRICKVLAPVLALALTFTGGVAKAAESWHGGPRPNTAPPPAGASFIDVSPDGRWTLWQMNAKPYDILLRDEKSGTDTRLPKGFDRRNWGGRWVGDSSSFFMSAATRRGGHVTLTRAAQPKIQNLGLTTVKGTLSYLPPAFVASPNRRWVAVGLDFEDTKTLKGSLALMGPFGKGDKPKTVVLLREKAPVTWTWLGANRLLVKLNPEKVNGRAAKAQKFVVIRFANGRVHTEAIRLQVPGDLTLFTPAANASGQVFAVVRLSGRYKLFLLETKTMKLRPWQDLGPETRQFIDWNFDQESSRWCLLWSPDGGRRGAFQFRLLDLQTRRVSPPAQVTGSGFPQVDGDGNVWVNSGMTVYKRPKF